MRAVCGLVVAVLGLVSCCYSSCDFYKEGTVSICTSFLKDYAEGITTLIFSGMDMRLINSTVFSSPKLRSVESLSLKESKIHTIDPGAFQIFSKLVTLELNNNNLTSVSPSWFSDNTTLKGLYLTGNVIGRLSREMLDGFSELRVLNLSQNVLVKIASDSFGSLSKLTSLDLSDNKLSSLEPSTLSSVENATFRLDGNPWDCSCAQKAFVQFLQELVNRSRLNDSSSVICHHPASLYGEIVWNVSEVICSDSDLPTTPGSVLHHGVLPALFVVLVIVVFILLLLLAWKKKQDQKQVRPDGRSAVTKDAADRRGIVTSGDVKLMTTDLFGRKVFGGLPQQIKPTSRAKSASAILQSGFHQVTPKPNVNRLNKAQFGRNLHSKGAKDLGGPDKLTERSMELWYYDSLQSANPKRSPTKAKSVLLTETPTVVLQHPSIRPASPLGVNTTKIPAVLLGPGENEGNYHTFGQHPEIQEPLVYLCVSSIGEEEATASPVTKETSENVFKPRLLKRTFTWPKEHLQSKEDTNASYQNFLKTLSLSPRPGGPPCTDHRSIKDQIQKYDFDKAKATSVVSAGEKVLTKEVNVKKIAPGGDDAKRSRGEARSQGGPVYKTSSPRKTGQRSGYGRQAARSKVVTPDSGVQREDLHSQQSEAQSDLRSTPDDDTLLENNEYNFIDLLHEVVENHGRWTRDRWKQTHQRMSNRP